MTAIATQTRQLYTAVTDDEPPSFIASLTSLVYSLRLSELLSGGFSLSLPPAPTPSTHNGIEKALDDDAVPLLAGDINEAALKTPTGTPTKNGGSNAVAPSQPPSRRPSIASPEASTSAKKLEERKEESAFKQMPNEVIVILLPFYDLLNSNKAFCGLVFNDTLDGAREFPSGWFSGFRMPTDALRPAAPPLPPALISLASYVVCHAAVSARARAYSRLCLILLTILVEEGEGKLTGDGVQIRLCRQARPAEAHARWSTFTDCVPLTASADVAPQHESQATHRCDARHRRHLSAAQPAQAPRRRDVHVRGQLLQVLFEGQATDSIPNLSVCLRLVQRIMQQLKNERVRLGAFLRAFESAALVLTSDMARV